MNSGEKVAIRTLALFMREGSHTRQTLIIKNTGSNKYTICVENLPNNTLQYSVIKNNKSGKFIGTLVIDRVSEYGIEYNNSIIGSIPDSIVKYIREHYITFNRYLSIGENAFR